MNHHSIDGTHLEVKVVLMSHFRMLSDAILLFEVCQDEKVMLMVNEEKRNCVSMIQLALYAQRKIAGLY